MKRNRNFILALVLSTGVLTSSATHTIVQYKTSTQFTVPRHTKRLALLGCTPHPTQYIKTHGYNRKKMRKLKLKDFIDVQDLTDSFDQTLHLCKQHNIDQLLVAYLPIYFIDLKQLLQKHFIRACADFFRAVVPQIQQLIQERTKKLGYKIDITIIVPPTSALKQIPAHPITIDDRVRYLIKQFPCLRTINTSDLKTIVIINNKGEDEQNENIIRYLRYQYLFEKPLHYEILSTNKPKFHKYLI